MFFDLLDACFCTRGIQYAVVSISSLTSCVMFANTYLAELHIFLRAVEVEAFSIPVFLACRNRRVSQDWNSGWTPSICSVACPDIGSQDRIDVFAMILDIWSKSDRECSFSQQQCWRQAIRMQFVRQYMHFTFTCLARIAMWQKHHHLNHSSFMFFRAHPRLKDIESPFIRSAFLLGFLEFLESLSALSASYPPRNPAEDRQVSEGRCESKLYFWVSTDQLANIIKISSIKAKPLSEHLTAELCSNFFCLLGKGTSRSLVNFIFFEFCLCFVVLRMRYYKCSQS